MNMILSRGGDHMVVGRGGNDRLLGNARDDILIGGLGAEFGYDRIVDFAPGEHDLKFYPGLTFGDLTIADVAGRAQISFGHGEIVLTGIQAADVMQSWFEFAP